MAADLTCPGVAGRGRERARESDPASRQRRERGHAPIRDDLACISGCFFREQTRGDKKGEEQTETSPSEAIDRGEADREREGRAAPRQPFHSPNNSRSTRFLSSAGAPCVRHRARRNFLNSSSKSNCSLHGGQSSRWSRISRSSSGVSSRSRNSYRCSTHSRQFMRDFL